jgi:hypothetical protein
MLFVGVREEVSWVQDLLRILPWVSVLEMQMWACLAHFKGEARGSGISSMLPKLRESLQAAAEKVNCIEFPLNG